jgi:hypothetical protein
MRERLTTGTASAGRRGGIEPSAAASHGEETLVVDARAQLRPAEMVERKLVALLRAVPLPVSQVSAAFRKR